MDDNQKKLIEEQMQRIPAEVREAIEASDWERTVFNIGRAHKMHIDDIDSLSIETILTMIGLEHPKDFPENLQKQTGVSDETLMEIVDEINERLFSKIRNALKEHYEKVSAGEIMAQEEKDTLHHAGISLDDSYVPTEQKKNTETLIDKKPAEEKISSSPIESEVFVEEAPKVVVSLGDSSSKPPQSKPRITFDPYREPIE